MADALVCEFAVFEPDELPRIPFAPGRWIWRREAEVPAAWAQPVPPLPAPRDRAWLAEVPRAVAARTRALAG